MNKMLLVVLLLTVAGASGCNTIDGAGQDLQRGGKAVSDTAKDVKHDM